MPVSNAEIAAQLEKIADLLDIEGANRFRVRAYRRAARTIGEWPQSVVEMLAGGQALDELPGIGKDLAEKIATLAHGAHLPVLDELEREVPARITSLLAIPGLGPKRVFALHETLGINDVAGLTKAAKAGKLRALPGFSAGIEERVLRAIDQGAGQPQRTLLPAAEQAVIPLVHALEPAAGVQRVVVAGSYRRRRKTVGDLDIVVAADPAGPVMDQFVAFEDVAEVMQRGTTRATVVLRNRLQVDLRVVKPESFGAVLLYFTGSKAHSIELRRIAQARRLKLNEYGLFAGTRRVAGLTEAEIYAKLDLPYIEPELREGHGEIAAAQRGALPKLVTLADIRGDLHAHTTASDGRASIADMARAAQAKGYLYLAITDHSQRIAVVHGLDARRLGRQIDEIDRLNAGLTGFVILKSIEVDILEDGSLDLPDSILKRLDIVVGAVHSRFELAQDKQTDRLLRAMDNRHLRIVAHPTGRLINRRPGYAIDFERVMRGAAERGCFLELNAQPDRLDLTDLMCRMAKGMGVKVAVSTDAHSPVELDFMRFGVDQARRGWLEPAEVLNTRPLAELKALLRRR